MLQGSAIACQYAADPTPSPHLQVHRLPGRELDARFSDGDVSYSAASVHAAQRLVHGTIGVQAQTCIVASSERREREQSIVRCCEAEVRLLAFIKRHIGGSVVGQVHDISERPRFEAHARFSVIRRDAFNLHTVPASIDGIIFERGTSSILEADYAVMLSGNERGRIRPAARHEKQSRRLESVGSCPCAT